MMKKIEDTKNLRNSNKQKTGSYIGSNLTHVFFKVSCAHKLRV